MMKKILAFFVLLGFAHAPNAFALNDRFLAEQGYLSTIGYSESLKTQAEGNGTVVAVIDSGVWLAHPDLEGSIWLNSREIPQNDIDDDNNGYIDDYYGWNFVDGNADMQAKTPHGTNVAGIIAARHDSIGIAGIAPKTKIMSLIACNTEGCSRDAIQNAIKYAVDNGANVINLSLGKQGYLGYNASFNWYAKYAYDHDVVIVAAAGNGDVEAPGALGQNLSFVKASPVCNESNGSNMIIGVGALGAPWSNYGTCVDILAPGQRIITTTVPAFSEEGYGYELTNGTSFSAPMVSAAAALLKSKYPTLKNWEIISILLSSSAQGRLNIAATLGYARPHCKINDVHPKQIKAGDTLVISGTNLDSVFRPRLLGDSGGASYSRSIAQDIIFLDSNRIELGTSALNLRPGSYRVADSESVCEVGNIAFSVLESAIPSPQPSTPIISVTNPAPVRELMRDPVTVTTPRTYDARLTQRLLGNILLQTESRGEAWYLSPGSGARYYLRDGSAAYNIMRSLGQGIADRDLNKIPASNTTEEIKNAPSICSANPLANRMKGKIMLQVQQHGEAWYVHPKNCRRIYLRDGNAAYEAMRYLGLGIKNTDLEKIPFSN